VLSAVRTAMQIAAAPGARQQLRLWAPIVLVLVAIPINIYLLAGALSIWSGTTRPITYTATVNGLGPKVKGKLSG
jgi:hypothetical protein